MSDEKTPVLKTPKGKPFRDLDALFKEVLAMVFNATTYKVGLEIHNVEPTPEEIADIATVFEAVAKRLVNDDWINCNPFFLDMEKLAGLEERPELPALVQKLYDRVKENQPFYVLYAQDTFAPQHVLDHIMKMAKANAPPEKVASAMTVYYDMKRWQQDNKSHFPD